MSGGADTSIPCELCGSSGGVVLWENPQMRIVQVLDPLHPVFCRVIWTGHVREMTDLGVPQRHLLLSAVLATESALRRVFPTCKINLASLGNLTPHLHWHVIARFGEDPHFPAPVWAAARHQQPVAVPASWTTQVAAELKAALGEASASVAAPRPGEGRPDTPA